MMDRMAEADRLGIPTLDMAWQVAVIPETVILWGSIARRLVPAGSLVHFYTWDYKFNALWKRQTLIPELGVAAAVEPNFSVYPSQPLAVSYYETFRKRTLARVWGEMGVRLLVDLNGGSTPDQEFINTIGVPDGWNAFAIRSHRETGLPGLNRDLAVARRISGMESPLLLVYGGSTSVRDWAESIGATWVPEHNDAVRGRLRGRGRTKYAQGRRSWREGRTQGGDGVQEKESREAEGGDVTCGDRGADPLPLQHDVA